MLSLREYVEFLFVKYIYLGYEEKGNQVHC